MTSSFIHVAPIKQTVGELSLESIKETAALLASRGGPDVPGCVSSIEDFQITGPEVIRLTSQAFAATNGTIVMSSGGTTGTPKLTFVPYEQSIGRIAQAWQPLSSENVMLNLYNPGRLWGSHYYMLALTQHLRCRIVPMGALSPDEVETYLPVIKAAGVDTLAGTPTAVHDFALGMRQCGANLPLKKVMWVGEPWNLKKKAEVEDIFPGVTFWGNYGSIETYVIGSNTATCPHDIFHLHPDQLLELDDDGALLTRAGEGWTVPTLRYRLGDTLKSVECPCAKPHAFQVKGRSDSGFKFGGTLFNSIELLAYLRMIEGVDEVQLEISGSKGQAIATDVAVNFVGSASPQTILARLMREFVDIDVRDSNGKLRLMARSVKVLERNSRIHKIPAVIWPS